MRPLIAVLLLCASLAACSKPKEEKKDPPTPEEKPTAKPTATVKPSGGIAAVTDYNGVWTTVDADGQPYDIVIFPNGQAVTTWTKGKDGAQGERGYWRKEGDNLIAVYDDGWTDAIKGDRDGLKHEGFAPGTPLDGAASNTAPVRRVEAPMAEFVGVWRLNKEPDGTYQYVTLQSNGRALSTVNGGTEGTWTLKEKSVECKWPDGWVDLIERTDSGWQKRSFVGPQADEQADISPAMRVGESRFVATTP